MYSASTRAAYAELYKTAEAALYSRLNTKLAEALKDHPLIVAALYEATNEHK